MVSLSNHTPPANPLSLRERVRVRAHPFKCDKGAHKGRPYGTTLDW